MNVRSWFLWVISLAVLAHQATARAEEGITVLSNSYENRYPADIVFRLEARSDVPIERITHSYTATTARVNAAPINFRRSASVKAEFLLSFDTSLIPPGTDILYWWLIEDQLGRKSQTEPISFTLLDRRFTWKSIEEGGVTVYSYVLGMLPEALSEDQMEAVLLFSHSGIRVWEATLGVVSPPSAVRVLLYRSKQDMASSLGYPANAGVFGIALSDQVVATHAASRHIMVHEMSHIMLRHYIGAHDRYDAIPAWLHEGLAEFMSRSVRDSPSSLFQGRQVPGLRHQTDPPGDPDLAELFYDQSWAVVRFMFAAYGRDKFTALLERLREGTGFEGALRDIYGLTTDELDRDWRARSTDSPFRPGPTSAEKAKQDFTTIAWTVGGGAIVLLLAAIGVVLRLLMVEVHQKRRS